MPKINKKSILEGIFSSIGIILFAYLIWSVKLDKIIDAISHITLPYFLISLLLVPVVVMVDTFRWKILAKDQDVDLDFFEMVKIYTAGLFLANVTPGSIGAYIRAKLLHDNGKSFGRSLSNVVVDISMRTLPLHITSMFALIFLFPSKLSLLPLILLLIAPSVLPLIVIYKGGKLGNRLSRRLFASHLSANYREKLTEGVSEIFDKPPHLISLIKSILVTCLALIPLMGLQIYMISLSLGIKIPFINITGIWVVSLSVTCLPVSISGLGVREASMVYLLSEYGIEKNTAIALSLLGYTVCTLVPSIAGAIFYIHHSMSRVRVVK